MAPNKKNEVTFFVTIEVTSVLKGSGQYYAHFSQVDQECSATKLKINLKF